MEDSTQSALIVDQIIYDGETDPEQEAIADLEAQLEEYDIRTQKEEKEDRVNKEGKNGERPRMSAYVGVLEGIINEVFRHEEHLLTPKEWRAIGQLRELSYDARYCFARLILRKPDTWITAKSMEKFKREIGSKALLPALKELCQPIQYGNEDAWSGGDVDMKEEEEEEGSPFIPIFTQAAVGQKETVPCSQDEVEEQLVLRRRDRDVEVIDLTMDLDSEDEVEEILPPASALPPHLTQQAQTPVLSWFTPPSTQLPTLPRQHQLLPSQSSQRYTHTLQERLESPGAGPSRVRFEDTDDDDGNVSFAQPPCSPLVAVKEEEEEEEEDEFQYDPTTLCLDCFGRDEQAMTTEELLSILTVEQLRKLASEMKANLKKTDKKSIIEALLNTTSNQTTLSFSTTNHNGTQKAGSTNAKGKGKAKDNGFFKQMALPFLKKENANPDTQNDKGEEGSKGARMGGGGQQARLRAIGLERLGKCIKINPSYHVLVRRLHIIYYRSTSFPVHKSSSSSAGGFASNTLFLPSLLTIFKKRDYPEYEYRRSSNIWQSRDEYLAYEHALELEMRLEEIQQDVEEGGLGGLDTPDSDGDDDGANRDVVARYGTRKTETKGLAMKRFFAKHVYAQWRRLVDAEKRLGVRQRTPGMERFEPGYIYTRIVSHCTAAFGYLKEYTAELRLLDELLEQRFWRRGKRGAWYERRALILATHLKKDEKGNIDWEGLDKARLGLKDALLDEDTGLVYRPNLVKRLHSLEIKLKLPLGERTRCTAALKLPVEVRIYAIKVDKTASAAAAAAAAQGIEWEEDEDEVGMMVDGIGRVVDPGNARSTTSPVKKRARTPASAKRVNNGINTPKGKGKGKGKGGNEQTPVRERITTYFGMSVSMAGPLGAAVLMTPTPGKVENGAKDKSVPPLRWNKKRTSGKSVWIGLDGKECNVEQRALQTYNTWGYKGFHAETRILTTLFSLLFWDILFAPVAGSFETPFQSAPLDLTEDCFYFARKCQIDARLEEIERGDGKEILMRHDEKGREKGTWCVGVRWDLCGREELGEIVECIGGGPLSIICRLFCEDYVGRSSGVPDLIVWKYEAEGEKICKFVEVKGPGDMARENQKLWFHSLLGAGAQVEICKVFDQGAHTEPESTQPKTQVAAVAAAAAAGRGRKASAGSRTTSKSKVKFVSQAQAVAVMRRGKEKSGDIIDVIDDDDGDNDDGDEWLSQFDNNGGGGGEGGDDNQLSRSAAAGTNGIIGSSTVTRTPDGGGISGWQEEDENGEREPPDDSPLKNRRPRPRPPRASQSTTFGEAVAAAAAIVIGGPGLGVPTATEAAAAPLAIASAVTSAVNLLSQRPGAQKRRLVDPEQEVAQEEEEGGSLKRRKIIVSS